MEIPTEKKELLKKLKNFFMEYGREKMSFPEFSTASQPGQKLLTRLLTGILKAEFKKLD